MILLNIFTQNTMEQQQLKCAHD